jgi:predicted nuclease of predicted toxin-antitoxin system
LGLKFVIDAQLPPALAAWIAARGHQAEAVRDLGLREAADSAIWDYALSQSAVIVTKDEDFALLAAKQIGPGVVWIRSGNLVNRLLFARMEVVWPQIVSHLESGIALVEVY